MVCSCGPIFYRSVGLTSGRFVFFSQITRSAAIILLSKRLTRQQAPSFHIFTTSARQYYLLLLSSNNLAKIKKDKHLLQMKNNIQRMSVLTLIVSTWNKKCYKSKKTCSKNGEPGILVLCTNSLPESILRFKTLLVRCYLVFQH